MPRRCKFCEKPAFIKLYYPKMYLCEEHFKEYFERKVKRVLETAKENAKIIQRGVRSSIQ